MDELSREKEARIAAEKLHASLSVDLEKANQEQQSSTQKVGLKSHMVVFGNNLDQASSDIIAFASMLNKHCRYLH